MVHDFIFELGCEELPSASVWPLADAFVSQLLAVLDKAQLQYGEVKRFATPRRLAVVIHDLQSKQESQSSMRRGPAVSAAYTADGQPTQALLGFALSCKVDPAQLSRLQTDKGEWIVHETKDSGAQTKDLLPGFVNQALSALAIAKPMRWGNCNEEFARPVHWALMMYGDEVLESQLLGIQSSNQSRGHRFHCPQKLTISSAAQYELQLQEAFVVADFAKRQELIKQQVNELAKAQDAIALMPQALLDEVTSIVEWPQSYLVSFEKEFLEVPAEALIAAMQVHQKCFALKDKSGHLLPYFITTANIASTNPTQVVLGNEKVMRARLSDAAFFFKQDKNQKLSAYIPATQQVVFQNKLGSLYDKSLRIQALMEHLSQIYPITAEHSQRAASLSKCDLMTGMVGEFPELQGLMGYYYALHDGENPLVAQALNEQYMPRFAADELPQSNLGTALSLADRIDTLVGLFAIGQKPSGIKDPFKLRRHALAVVRLLISMPVALNLSTLIEEALLPFASLVQDKDPISDLKSFILERLQSHYQSQGFAPELILAVRARQNEWLFDLDSRLNALKSFITMPEASFLSAACKRVNNILTQNQKDGIPTQIEDRLLAEDAEKALFDEMINISASVDELYLKADYSAILQQLASLKAPIDVFFDKVMVMVEQNALRGNRLAILAKLQSVLQGVADISMLQL